MMRQGRRESAEVARINGSRSTPRPDPQIETWQPPSTPDPQVLLGGLLNDAVEAMLVRLVNVLKPRLTRKRLRRVVEGTRIPGSKETLADLCRQRGCQIWDRTPSDVWVYPFLPPWLDRVLDDLSRLDAALERGDQATIGRVSERLRDRGEVLAMMEPVGVPRSRRRRWDREERRRWDRTQARGVKLGVLTGKLQYVPRPVRRLGRPSLDSFWVAVSEVERQERLQHCNRQGQFDGNVSWPRVVKVLKDRGWDFSHLTTDDLARHLKQGVRRWRRTLPAAKPLESARGLPTRRLGGLSILVDQDPSSEAIGASRIITP